MQPVHFPDRLQTCPTLAPQRAIQSPLRPRGRPKKTTASVRSVPLFVEVSSWRPIHSNRSPPTKCSKRCAAEIERQGHADHALRLGQPQGAAEGPGPHFARPQAIPREAFVVLFDNATNTCYEATLSLTDGSCSRGAHPRRAADDDDRRADRVRAGRAGQPRVQGRPQAAVRHRRHAAW